LRLQQGQHLAVLLQLITEGINQRWQNRDHRSLTEKGASP
jgi:hypothetical protein